MPRWWVSAKSTVDYGAGYVKYMYRQAGSCSSLSLIRTCGAQRESCPAGLSAAADSGGRHEREEANQEGQHAHLCVGDA